MHERDIYTIELYAIEIPYRALMRLNQNLRCRMLPVVLVLFLYREIPSAYTTSGSVRRDNLVLNYFSL